ncbi:MAG: hypothetical protein GAK35_01035 [Herbaspirillum frisingense]|uniref:Uncharacterized protein n=1 Tax=Herbaspirillum frisingense TaxID=92645 RepID=A0A7V8FYT8_9BURK|nr:MAG: hypothetical protein GAK35_01035 [Herbaspirillum frisingense]
MLQQRRPFTAASVQDLSDMALMFAIEEANDDLAAAAGARPESAWHKAAFAAVMLLMGELYRRRTPLFH